MRMLVLLLFVIRLAGAIRAVSPEGGPHVKRALAYGYNHTEWDQLAPRFSETELRSLSTLGGEQNLCQDGHLIPELMIIGAPKAASTSTCANLRGSPDLIFPLRKEQMFGNEYYPSVWKEGHYFDHQWANGEGCELLRRDFGECPTDKRRVGVEGSVRYAANYRTIPSRIETCYGGLANRITFVVVMRDPLKRFHSHYYHAKRDHWCPEFTRNTFKATCKQVLQLPKNWSGPQNWADISCEDYITGGSYEIQLQEWFKKFSSSQFVVVPMLNSVAPGTDGRPTATLSEFLWDRFGVRGKLLDLFHANNHHNPSLKADLSEDLIVKMRSWFSQHGGSVHGISKVLADSDATLFQYTGARSDQAAIAKHISDNWGA